MGNISADEVNKLRKQTGVGMMDCKKALVECNGDFEKAIDYLRKKGQKVASNRADKEANEGIIIAKTSPDNKKGVIIVLNCETDFVAKNDEFVSFAKNVLDIALNNNPKTIEELKNLNINNRSVSESLTDLMGKIGEKLELSKYECIEAQKVYIYNHQGNRLATVVGFNKDNARNIDEIGKEIAMQIAAMSPIAVDKDNVDPKVIEREIEIGKEQAVQEGKPAEMAEKIAIGKLNKFFKESTLLNQMFVRDNNKTIRQYLAENDSELTVTSFKRFMLGS